MAYDAIRQLCHKALTALAPEPGPKTEQIPQFSIDTQKDQDNVHLIRAYLEEYICLFHLLDKNNPGTSEIRERLKDIITRHALLFKTLTSKIETHSPVPLNLMSIPRLDTLSVEEIQSEFDKVARTYASLTAILETPYQEDEEDARNAEQPQYTFTETTSAVLPDVPTTSIKQSQSQSKSPVKSHRVQSTAKQALAS